MTRPTARVLAMLELLQTGGQRTVGDLAARLGVDERTVRRYAEHLTDLGIPVQAQRGRYGGYRLSPGYKLPPLTLTDDEAVADTLLSLASAAQARRSVIIAYTAWDGRESQRDLDVYGLVFHSGRWYVTGHDHGSDDVRTFRLDRVASVKQGDGSYVVPADFDARTQVVSGITAFTWSARGERPAADHPCGSGQATAPERGAAR